MYFYIIQFSSFAVCRIHQHLSRQTTKVKSFDMAWHLWLQSESVLYCHLYDISFYSSFNRLSCQRFLSQFFYNMICTVLGDVNSGDNAHYTIFLIGAVRHNPHTISVKILILTYFRHILILLFIAFHTHFFAIQEPVAILVPNAAL